MRRTYLGIDCGTQSTKALLFDAEDGAELATGRADHDLVSTPDGAREQDPRWWVAAAEMAIRQALAGAPRVEVAGIGVSGQQHGLVALDAAGVPVRPAKLWNDTSTISECDALTARMGGEVAVHAATGNVFLAGYTAPKVEWLRVHEPAAYAAATGLCLPHDYLDLWLTGEFATEAGDASGTAYVDVRRREYAPAVLAAIDANRDWDASLPPILASGAVLGTLRPAAAAALGLPPGIPVSTGGGDNMCAAIGVGAVEPGMAVMSLGTSGTVFGYSVAPAIDPLREVSAFCDSTGGWLPLACVLNCALPLDWVRGLFGLDHAGFDALAMSAAPGAAGLAFVPYLDGERTPNRPAAAGEMLGLRATHGRAEIARAVLEGVTAGLAHAVQAFERTGVTADEILLVGGAARSDGWGQILADWLGLPIVRPAVAEAAARGAAIHAAHVVGGAPLARAPVSGSRWTPGRSAATADTATRYRDLLATR
ncbi:MAG: xylulokinase [Candidatus Limnocylindrales bacterium]